MNDAGIGNAPLGYGLSGMILGPFLGRLADRFGRLFIVPLGFLIASSCAFLFIPISPLWSVRVLIFSLSIGFDMTHPLMSGIINALDPKRRGQAMGINAFATFTGFGLGSVLFQLLLNNGFDFALAIFGSAELVLAILH